MNRRTFLNAGLLSVAGLSAQKITGADPERRIKAGFLGVTHSHGAEKYRLVAASSEFEPLGIFDDSPQASAVIKSLGARTLREDEVLRQSDVVIVESAVWDLGRYARKALEAGKHVHVEKPPTDNLEEMKVLVSLAKEKKLLFQAGYMWRYHPGFQKIFEAVRAGWLGEIYQVRGRMANQLAQNRRKEWAVFKGGAMFELGCHLIDPMVRLFGKPGRIAPSLRSHRGDDLKDNNVVLFEFAHVTGVLTNSTLQPNASTHRCFEILGTNGSAILQPIEPPQLQLDLAKPAGPYKAGLQNVPLPEYKRYVGDLHELAAAIRGEKKLSVSPDEELLVQEAVLKACEMG